MYKIKAKKTVELAAVKPFKVFRGEVLGVSKIHVRRGNNLCIGLLKYKKKFFREKVWIREEEWEIDEGLRASMRLYSVDAFLSLLGAKDARRARAIADPLQAAMLEFKITSGPRIAAFLANILVETQSLQFLRELYIGSVNRDYIGRGCLFIRGEEEYKLCGESLGLNLVKIPQLAESVEHAPRVGAWLWVHRNLNNECDEWDENGLLRAVKGLNAMGSVRGRRREYMRLKSAIQALNQGTIKDYENAYPDQEGGEFRGEKVI